MYGYASLGLLKGVIYMSDYKYVFGPVPSRRMGLSIGISPINKGHCNYSCIYCQLGRTKNMTNERYKYFHRKDIINEFKDYLKNRVNFDVATIVGDGEPTLYSELGYLIEELISLTNKPIAVITNGALLTDNQVRQELRNAHIVLPSLDAYNQDMFKKINRPHGKIKFHDVVSGIRNFAKEFNGEVWLETMMIKDVKYDRKSLLELKKLLDTINYQRLYINTPVRPPAEGSVRPPTKKSVNEAISILEGISIDELVSEGFYSEIKDDYEAILSIIERHPMNQFEIKSFIEKRGNTNVKDFFNMLEDDNNIEVINYKNYDTYRLK